MRTQGAPPIAERYGDEVADIVCSCTDAADGLTGAGIEPWLACKTRYVASLEHKSEGSLRVTAADKAHNARGIVVDSCRNPRIWERFYPGLEGSAWYLLRIHQTLSHRLPGSRSNELIGESVKEILASEVRRHLAPDWIAPVVWAGGYAERTQSGPQF